VNCTTIVQQNRAVDSMGLTLIGEVMSSILSWKSVIREGVIGDGVA